MSIADGATDRFSICLPFILAQEAPDPNNWSNPVNFSNDAHDAGGKTFMGITQSEYDIWRKSRGLPCRDIRKVTQDEGDIIYRDSYWLPHCPILPIGLDLSFFDECVNTGTCEATKILQAVLGLDNDGEWGPKTQVAVDELGDVRIIINSYMLRRQAVYRMMKSFKYFGMDWLRRAKEIGSTSLSMASGAIA